MTISTHQSEQGTRAVILVKALPQPSKNYGETVCCAGVTAERSWKRLFPVRFRHLSGEQSFKRWDWVKFRSRRPTTDLREESCHVFEDSIVRDGQLKGAERARLLGPLILGSAKEAASRNQSLALIRPRNTRFIYKKKSNIEIAEQREAFERAARQTSMFDKELAQIEPTPYYFRFKFDDDSGAHNYENGDWEAHAMYWRATAKMGSDRGQTP